MRVRIGRFRLTPGMIVTLFGTGMGPADGVIASLEDGKVPTSVAGVRVLFNGFPAPLLFVREDQINALFRSLLRIPPQLRSAWSTRPDYRPIYGQCQDRGSGHLPHREH